MMRPRYRLFAVAALAAFAALLAGCAYYVLPPVSSTQDEDPAEEEKETLQVTVLSTRLDMPYYPGDTLTVSWRGEHVPKTVSLSLYDGLEPVLDLNPAYTGDEPYVWTIPSGQAPGELYRIRVAGLAVDKEPAPEGYSAWFAIDTEPDTGLSDVTVTQREITLTVTDNGSLVDGDTVDILLNGTPVAQNHVLVGPPGTAFAVSLQGGANTLEIVAIDEGSVSPNTAQLQISKVSVGESVQTWRLTTAQAGSLTVSAP